MLSFRPLYFLIFLTFLIVLTPTPFFILSLRMYVCTSTLVGVRGGVGVRGCANHHTAFSFPSLAAQHLRCFLSNPPPPLLPSPLLSYFCRSHTQYHLHIDTARGENEQVW
uniref:Uncharacterized protein n=1 Tax=Palpitomonas bilix TaxID=652834 RepID=A0A7S3G0E9_9EUKA